jgi:hypothetical protein
VFVTGENPRNPWTLVSCIFVIWWLPGTRLFQNFSFETASHINEQDEEGTSAAGLALPVLNMSVLPVDRAFDTHTEHPPRLF